MNAHLLESLYFRLGEPSWFWPLVFIFVFASFFLIDGIAQVVA